MRTHVFEQEIRLPRPVGEVFAFFSDAANLERLTPPFLSFEILTPEVDMREGALIDYKLRLRGVPIRWRTAITLWDPPHRFVDEQLRGPYRLWRHRHTFEEVDGDTLVGDRVEYAVPLDGLIFGLVDRLFVRRDVERIFAYRAEVLEEIFGEGDERGGARATRGS